MAQTDGPSPSFWDEVGANFPSLKGAVSTAYYFDCERWLFETYLPKLGDLVVFKTDLWDEAKNTEILRWAADHGARPLGVDVSIDVVREARKVLHGAKPAELPAERPTRFQLVANLRTAKLFGMTLPPSILLRADEVIE